MFAFTKFLAKRDEEGRDRERERRGVESEYMKGDLGWFSRGRAGGEKEICAGERRIGTTFHKL